MVRKVSALSFVIVSSALKLRDDFGNATKEQLCPVGGVTSLPRADGFGSHYAPMMYMYACAQKLNRTYCHLEWSVMDYGLDPEGMFEFVGGSFYGLPAIKRTLAGAVDFSRECYGKGWSFNRYLFTDDVRSTLLSFYNATSKPELDYYVPGVMKVAWHLRRGSTCHEPLNPFCDQISTAIEGVPELKRIYGDNLTDIHIFSVGEASHFRGLVELCSSEGIVCHLHLGTSDEDVKKGYHHMVMADTFIYGGRTTALGISVAVLRQTGDTYTANSLHTQPNGSTQPIDMPYDPETGAIFPYGPNDTRATRDVLTKVNATDLGNAIRIYDDDVQRWASRVSA